MSTQTIDRIRKEVFSLPEALAIVADLNREAEDEKRRRLEFYEWIDEDTKAEFINGEIVLHSPARVGHVRASTQIQFQFLLFLKDNPIGEIMAEKAMVHLTRNSYEPDIIFFSKEKSSAFTDDQVLLPAPDLVIEILSPSTERHDRGIKFEDYAAHGVAEYWIVDANNKTIEQYLNQDNKFELAQKATAKDSISSRVLTGFVIRLEDIFSK